MSQNQEYQKKAHALIPGGAHTYSRGDDQYPLNAPPVLSRGKGAYVWDADDKRYLDYGMALRAVTIGYDYDRISAAAIREIHKGNLLTRPSTTEIDAAEAITKLIPWVEMVKFAKNGSTVTSAAIKLARAHTGRTMVARCLQHPFFSFDDWFIGDTPMSSGVPAEIQALTVNFNYNDLASLEAQFVKHPGKIAAVILEPATTEEPAVGKNGLNFLQEVEALCKKQGAVLVLDEMITGFRWHDLGAAQKYGIKPDLVTFGKGSANGFSVAALGGKREIMELGGIHHNRERVFLISTTYGAEMSGLGAFIETLKVYKELKVVDKLWSYGKSLREGMNACAREAGIEGHFTVEGFDCMPSYMTRDRNKQVSLELRTLFSQEMIRAGVLMPWIAVCYEHGDRELDITLEAVRKALKVYAQALEEGTSKLLDGRAIKPVFRKFN